MELWNIKNLECPPRNTYKASNYNVDIDLLREVFRQALDKFNNQNRLNREAALLSRLLYRLKLKFRSNKVINMMSKLNHALLLFLRMDVPRMLETFSGMLPKSYTQNTFLPTRNMLHYILVRIQGLSRLLVRAAHFAEAAAHLMRMQIYVGHFWRLWLICFSVISCIYALTKELARFCCALYSQLAPFAEALQNVGLPWLPPNYDLPDDLNVWLGVDWLKATEMIPQLTLPESLKLPRIFEILDSDSDVEAREEILDDIQNYNFTTDENDHVQVNRKRRMDNEKKLNQQTNAEKLNSVKFVQPALALEEDVGEVVQINKAPKKKRQKQELKTSRQEAAANQKATVTVNGLIKKIKTLEDLQDFEKNFKVIKKQQPHLFKNLDKLQCKMLLKTVKKLCSRGIKSGDDLAKRNMYVKKARAMLKLSLV